MSTLPWYSDEEIDDLCDGRKANAAKVRHLQTLGLTVHKKPNGKPLLLRAHAETVLSGLAQIEAAAAARASPKPDRAAFKLLYGGKGA